MTVENDAPAMAVITVGDSILVQNKSDKLYYEAKILSADVTLDDPVYMLHYKGWNKSHDEKVAQSDLMERMAEATEENKEYAKTQREAKLQELATKKGRKSSEKTPTARGTPTARVTPTSNDRLSQSGGLKSRSSAKRETPASESSLPSALKKRKKNEEDFSTPKSALPRLDKTLISLPKLELTEKLFDLLTADKEKLQGGHISKLPSRITISEIITEYAESLQKPFTQPLDELVTEDPMWTNKEIDECLAACYAKDVFDVTVMNQLLYPDERQTFEAYHAGILKDVVDQDGPEQEIRLSSHLGIVHLLRCLTKFNEFMGYLPNLNNFPVRKGMCIEKIKPFVSFLEKNYRRYWKPDVDYVPIR